MDRTEAISAIRRSLGRGSATPCTWAEDREAYIEEKASQLLDAVIEPIAVAVTGTFHETGLKEQLTGKSVFAIARRDKGWLLYLQERDEFALAFGEDPNDLAVLGFSSNDALSEWLG